MSKEKRILIDCSYVYTSGLNTGIQRVVKNIATIAKKMGTYRGYTIELVVLEEDRIFEIDSIPDNTKQSIKAMIYHYFVNIYYTLQHLFNAIFPFEVVRKFISSPKNIFGLSYLVGTPIRLYHNFFKAKHINTLERVILLEDDILILLDSTWHLDIRKPLAEAKQNKTTIITVIYDLIPIYYPQFCSVSLVKIFTDWFHTNKMLTDGYLAISETVKNDLIQYLQNSEHHHFDSFMLGSNINKKNETNLMISKKLTKVFEEKKDNVYIIVSTIEIRKNHEYLLNAFDELWKRGVDVKLCIIGRLGWHVDELLNRIEIHSEKDKKLFMFNGLNDESLLFAYQYAKALVFPSFVEGFGLPIVESLQKRLPVLASDTPIHREVGKDNIGYFDLNDSNDLVNQIIQIENEGIPEELIPKSDIHIYNWEESTKDLLDKSIEMTKRINKYLKEG